MPNILGRDAILQAQDLKIELVSVPEWGGDVYVKGLNGRERDAFEAAMLNISPDGKSRKVNMVNIRARLCSLSICDERGERLFTDLDIDVLAKKSAAALDRVFSVAQRLSGISDGDIEELEKNSGSAQGEDSSSD